MGPTWALSAQVGPMLAAWTLLSGYRWHRRQITMLTLFWPFCHMKHMMEYKFYITDINPLGSGDAFIYVYIYGCWLCHHWLRFCFFACMTLSHYLNNCWLVVNWTFSNSIWWNFCWIAMISIQENIFVNVFSKIAAILSQSQSRSQKLMC